MKKVLLILSLLTPNLFAFSDGQFVQVSSNTFYRVNVDSTNPSRFPDETTVSSNTLRQIIFTNNSSSSTVFFSTATSAGVILSSGTPLYPREHLTIDVDPTIAYSSQTRNAFYFLRQDGTGETGFIDLRVWLRHTK